MKDNSFMQYVMIALLVVGAYMVGVYKTKTEYLEAGAPAQVAQVAGDTAPEEQPVLLEGETWDKVMSDGVFKLGEESAPIKMVEFTDYQCPFCSRYVSDTFDQIKSNYIDTGKVEYIVRDLPLSFHEHAELAAVAVRCAARDGKGAELHDKLFANQEDWSELADATDTFVSYAREVGVGSSFASCLSDESVKAAVQADLDLATSVGANGTPTFFINGQMVVGAQPYAAFETVIEGML